MRFTLTPRDVSFLHKILFNPYQLPLKAVEGSGLQPYKPTGSPKDVLRTGKMLASLKTKWFNVKVVERLEEKDGLTFHTFHKKDIEVSLTQVYLDLLISVVEHYQPIGILAESVDMYVPLIHKLRGEKYIEDEFLDEESPEEESEKKVSA